MNPALNYWFFFGTFFLIILTYQDFKNKRVVDDRSNYVMMGLSLSLLSHLDVGILLLLSVLVVSFVLRFFLKKFSLVGESDANALAWIFYGLGLISVFKLVWFFFFFSIITAAYFGLSKLYVKLLEKHQKRKIDKVFLPFYHVILLSFVLSALLFGAY